MIMQYDIGEEKNLREINKNQFIAIFAVILIITVVFLTFNLTRETCGNSICRGDENCFDCPKDCKCGEGEYCYSKEKKCIKPTCGDGKCEPYEDQYNCCLDCKCILPSEICNEETKKCEIQEMNISDKRVVELIIAYFKELNMEINSTEITGIGSYYEKLVKIVKVQISGEEWFRYIGVTENGEIIELPIL